MVLSTQDSYHDVQLIKPLEDSWILCKTKTFTTCKEVASGSCNSINGFKFLFCVII